MANGFKNLYSTSYSERVLVSYPNTRYGKAANKKKSPIYSTVVPSDGADTLAVVGMRTWRSQDDMFFDSFPTQLRKSGDTVLSSRIRQLVY